MFIIVLIIFFALLAMGIPIAIAMGGASMWMYMDNGFSMVVFAQRMLSGVNSFSLMALPLFLLAGNIMGEGGLTRRLLALANMLFGRYRASMSTISIGACALFGTCSGSGPATTMAVGGVTFPEMRRQGYSDAFIASVLGASGTLGMIIPPSLPMVILGVTVGISIGDLFLGGFIPGVTMTLTLCIISYIVCRKRNYGEPSKRKYTKKEALKICWDAFLPLLSPVIILGGVFSGIVTPTEASVSAVVYGLLLTAIYHEITLKRLGRIFIESAIAASAIMIVISVATAFSWILTMTGVPAMISAFFLSFASNKISFLFALSGVMLIFGCITEGTSLIVLLAPIFFPIAQQLGVDPVQFGLVFVCNIALGSITPPVGLTLMSGMKLVDKNMGLEKTFPDCIYMMIAQAAAIVIIILFPEFCTFLPGMFGAGV